MTASAKSKKKKHPVMRKEQYRTYIAFTAVGFALYCIFLILPIVMGFFYSLTDWNGIGASFKFVGFENYAKILTSDKKFYSALLFTLRYTLMLVICCVVISFILAMLLNRKLKGRTFYRTVYFLPAVLSMITVGLIFKQMFFYVFPGMGEALNLGWLKTNILSQKSSAIYGILFVHLWQGCAIPTLLFLAGLQTIPQDMYEATAIDGANAWNQFRYVTVPYILPTLSVVLVLVVKQGLNVFDYVSSMTSGGPGGATRSLALLIYQNAFERYKYSYSIAQAVLTGLLIALISFIQIKFTSSRRIES